MTGWLRRRRRRRWYSTVYLRSPHWAAVRAWALALAGYRCSECGRTVTDADGGLDVHHLHYRTLWHEGPSDVAVLCHRPCHERKRGMPWR